jgi:hypothetical protein
MNQTITAEQPLLLDLPLFQPLRYWTPKSVDAQSPVVPKRRSVVNISTSKCFSMKGGYYNFGGERRLIIAGKIFRNDRIGGV